MVGHHPRLWAWALHQEDSKGWLALGTLGAGSGVGWGVVCFDFALAFSVLDLLYGSL